VPRSEVAIRSFPVKLRHPTCVSDGCQPSRRFPNPKFPKLGGPSAHDSWQDNSIRTQPEGGIAEWLATASAGRSITAKGCRGSYAAGSLTDSDRPKADIRLAPVSTRNPEPQEFLHSPAFDPPRLEKLAHKFLHPRKIQVEDQDHGPYRVVHKLPVF